MTLFMRVEDIPTDFSLAESFLLVRSFLRSDSSLPLFDFLLIESFIFLRTLMRVESVPSVYGIASCGSLFPIFDYVTF